MSFDLVVLSTETPLNSAQADAIYGQLCNGDNSSLIANPAIDAFYKELTALHPEIDDIPEDQVDNVDLCPWSIAMHRSPGHLIISAVWSKAEYVEQLIRRLALKHKLRLFDPQKHIVHNPN